jgi:hypothetical protein
MIVRFYASTDGSGNPTAVATASIYISPQGVVQHPDGTPLGSVGSASTLASVSIPPGQTVEAGQTLTVLVQASDLNGNLIPLTPGSVHLTVAAGQGYGQLNSAGDLLGVSAGTVTLTASADGFTSVPQTIQVNSLTINPSRSLAISNNAMAMNPVSGNIWVSVTAAANSYADDVIEVSPTTGAVLRSIAMGAEPNALAISSDGTQLYASIKNQETIKQVDLTTGIVVSSFVIQNPQGFVNNLAVQPNQPDVVAMSLGDGQIQSYKGGLQQSVQPTVPFAGISLGWYSPTVLYTYNSYDTGYDLDQFTASSSGLVPKADLQGRLMGFTTVMHIFGNNVYGSNGSVVNGATGNLLGHFSVQGGTDVAVNTTDNVAIFATTGEATNFNVFSGNTYTPTISFIFSGLTTQSSVSGMALYASKGLAFRTFDHIYFIDQCPGL